MAKKNAFFFFFFCVLVGFRLCFSGCILPAYHRLNSCSITAAVAAVAAVAEVQQQQAGGGAEWWTTTRGCPIIISVPALNGGFSSVSLCTIRTRTHTPTHSTGERSISPPLPHYTPSCRLKKLLVPRSLQLAAEQVTSHWALRWLWRGPVMEEFLAGALLALADGAQCATRLSIRSPPGTHVTLPWENLQKRHIMDQPKKKKKKHVCASFSQRKGTNPFCLIRTLLRDSSRGRLQPN